MNKWHITLRFNVPLVNSTNQGILFEQVQPSAIYSDGKTTEIRWFVEGFKDSIGVLANYVRKLNKVLDSMGIIADITHITVMPESDYMIQIEKLIPKTVDEFLQDPSTEVKRERPKK